MESKFYKIGEISKLLEVRTSTLRYWETEFNQLKPVKSSGGQRFYTQKHIDLLQSLKQMLYNEKYTIDGAKKKLKDYHTFSQDNIVVERKIINAHRQDTKVDEIRKELKEILTLLK